MKRFMTVRHPVMDSRLAVHGLLSEYHWESVDTEYVLCLATYPGRNHALLEAHADVLVMPSVFDATSVHAHALNKDKHAHFLSLKQALGLNESHATSDLAVKAASRYGPKFHLDV